MKPEPTEPVVAEPRCPKCGYVMCQQFDSRPINALADMAIPNGQYVCYHCANAPEPAAPLGLSFSQLLNQLLVFGVEDLARANGSMSAAEQRKLADYIGKKIGELRAAAPPFCQLHRHLDERGYLEVEVGGNNCVACSLNERAAMLKMLALFAPADGSKDSLQVLQSIIDTRAAAQPAPSIDVEKYIAEAEALSNQGRFDDAFGVLVNTLRSMKTAKPAAEPVGARERAREIAKELIAAGEGNGCEGCKKEFYADRIAQALSSPPAASGPLDTGSVDEAVVHLERIVHDSDMKRNRRRLWEGAQYVLALLETIRDNKTTNAATGAQTCVRCGHSGSRFDRKGRCLETVSAQSEWRRFCGCHCEFPATTTAAEPDPIAKIPEGPIYRTGDGWFPISTAPKDSPILLFGHSLIDEDYNPNGVVEGFWLDDKGWVGAIWNNEQDCYDLREIEPTDWTPFPSAPTIARTRTQTCEHGTQPATTPAISEAIACVEKLRDEWTTRNMFGDADRARTANLILDKLRTLQPSTPSEKESE